MRIDEIVDFLETHTISFTFSTNGLRYLSLKDNSGEEFINLRRFNRAEEENPMVSLLIKETLNFFNTGIHNMPLDISNFTSFQQDVFNETLNIKEGEIYTYKEIAIKIGNPDAARAVGNALSRSPFAYFMPTHRVLPKKGIGKCKSGAGFLRNKLLELEGHDINKFCDL